MAFFRQKLRVIRKESGENIGSGISGRDDQVKGGYVRPHGKHNLLFRQNLEKLSFRDVHAEYIVLRMGERYNIHSQLEHLQSKYIGTGHADTTKFEWMVNQHRDSCSSYMGHHDLLNAFAIAENESKARVRFNIMEKMLQPCGPPPEKPED